MDIQWRSKHGETVDDRGQDRVEEALEQSLARFGDRVVTVEVHVADEASGSSDGNDHRCTLDAQVAGHKNLSVTNHGSSAEEACMGAVQKLVHLLTSRLGKEADRRQGSESIRHLPVEEGLV
ncbi:hypothetical protein AB6N24_16620 [Cellulomonas sp. 179-A 4D5 NHS]|uniref:hypothetical protein n=1 Tax=Cellulomonas sp. 179-A 4D5 NHS TaxID=3142378 RepID=UPI00399FF5C7